MAGQSGEKRQECCAIKKKILLKIKVKFWMLDVKQKQKKKILIKVTEMRTLMWTRCGATRLDENERLE